MGSEGVFSAEGQAWRAQRKLSVAALAQRNLRNLYPAIEKVSTRLLAHWRKLAGFGATLDIVEEFKLFTVDVTTLITFGYDVNTIEQRGDVIQQKLNQRNAGKPQELGSARPSPARRRARPRNKTLPPYRVADLRRPRETRVMALFRQTAIGVAHFHDPKAFRPERWLGRPEVAHDVATMFPFGSGPRMCPGRALALIEMNVALSMLYKNFEVERVGTADEVSEKFSFAMEPVGLRVRLRPRASAA